ncbi:Protein BEST-3 [Aphelenchoides avenae]|nr:Protein BEST-3 [Aphelenchus avenae]
MTVTYTLDVSSSTFLGLHKLLLRWRGSIWKSIWPELLCWLTVYFTISAFYRYAMTKEQQLHFEDIVIFFYTYSDYIPITVGNDMNWTKK